MARIQIWPNSPDDPISYFQIRSWVDDLTPKFADGVVLENDDGTNVIIEVKDAMMSMAEVEEIARELVGYTYNYQVY